MQLIDNDNNDDNDNAILNTDNVSNDIILTLSDNNVKNDIIIDSDKLKMLKQFDVEVVDEFVLNNCNHSDLTDNFHFVPLSAIISTQELSNISLKPNFLKTTPITANLAADILKSSPLTAAITNFKKSPLSIIEGTPDLTNKVSPLQNSSAINESLNQSKVLTTNPSKRLLTPSISKLKWNQVNEDTNSEILHPTNLSFSEPIKEMKIATLNLESSMTDICIPSSILSTSKLAENKESLVEHNSSDVFIPSSILNAPKTISKNLSSPRSCIKVSREIETQCSINKIETFASTFESQNVANEFTYSPTQEPAGFSVISPDCFLESIPKHLNESNHKSQLPIECTPSSIVSFSIATVDISKLKFSDIQVHFEISEKEIIDKSFVNNIILNNPPSLIGISGTIDKVRSEDAPIVTTDLEETIPECSMIDLCEKSPIKVPVANSFDSTPSKYASLNINFDEGVNLISSHIPDTIETLIDPFLDPDPTQLTQHQQIRIDSNAVTIPISPQYLKAITTPKSIKKLKINTPILNPSPLSKIDTLNKNNLNPINHHNSVIEPNSNLKPHLVIKLSNSEIPCIVKSSEKRLQSNKRRKVIDDSDDESYNKTSSLNLKNDFNSIYLFSLLL